MVLSKKKILIISPESWGKSFVSKHHYANYLSQKGNDVFFLSPPTGSSFFVFSKIKIDRIKNTSIINLNYKNIIPKINLLPSFIQRFFYRKMANSIQRQINIKEFDIVWSFDPFRFWDFEGWTTIKKIYHTVDVHFNAMYEHVIAKHADFVFATTEVLIEPLKVYNSNIYKIRHGADIDGFNKYQNKLIELPGKNIIKAGLVGNFNNNVDYELIEQCAVVNKDIDFIMVGPYTNNNLSPHLKNTASIDKLKKQDNVFFIGEVESDEIICYLTKFDINLVLYREDKRNIIISPHKMMGYFYSGSAIVSSFIKEYSTFTKAYLCMCDHNKDIPKMIKSVKEQIVFYNSVENKLLRKGFAIENSYFEQINKIEKIISK